MLDIIATPDDVLAITIAGKITGEDFDIIMDRLDQVMTTHDKVHIFVETKVIDGIVVSGLPGYVTRALPLFGKLGRFGRVAVVADQAWIRWGTRIESAMLPFISYRTFEPAQREEALGWVVGR